MRVALTFSFLILAVLAPAAQAASGTTRIIVGRDPGLTGSERADIRRDAGVTHVRTLALPNTELVATAEPRDALAALRQDPDVRYAELDRVRHAFTNDPDYGTQWALDNTGSNLHDNFVFGAPPHDPLPYGTADADMDVPGAWSLGFDGAGVTVAVVDSGVDAGHPDLAGQIDTTLSRGFVGGTDSGYDDGEGHGTHVSGIIGALSGNSEGVSGIAPGATLAELKALDDHGDGSDSDIAAAFNYAGAQGIPVVNASLGGPGASLTLTDSMARHPDTLYVLAAGNDGSDNDASAMWPCNAPAPNIICVGASTQNDGAASFSNFGRETVDLFAPGEYINSTLLGGGYGLESGTSMASPAVAAEAALVQAAAPSLTPTQVKATILAAGDTKSPFAGLSVTGRRANAQAAVTMAAAHTIPADADGDGVPDNLDPSTDTDGDGVADGSDRCPTVAAATADGCPAAAVVTPPPTPTPTATPAAADADGDGRPDPSDLCPAEPAATTTGCPVPGLRSLVLKLQRSKHRATFKARTTRSATVRLVVERRVCNSRGKRCRWRSVYDHAKGSRSNAATFTARKLTRGRYRVSVRVSSPAGKAKTARQSFRL